MQAKIDGAALRGTKSLNFDGSLNALKRRKWVINVPVKSITRAKFCLPTGALLNERYDSF